VFAWLARHQGEDVGGSANADDVGLLYLDMCLISKLVSPAKVTQGGTGIRKLDQGSVS
jgi:hypothetical protein